MKITDNETPDDGLLTFLQHWVDDVEKMRGVKAQIIILPPSLFDGYQKLLREMTPHINHVGGRDEWFFNHVRVIGSSLVEDEDMGVCGHIF